MKLPFDPVKVAAAKLFGNFSKPNFLYGDVVKERTWACVDLGAFPRTLPRYKNLEGVVIMEDRDPEFFLSFDHYRPWASAHLNHHGPLKERTTEHDLKELVKELHDQKIKVVLGFWNYAGGGLGFLSKASFLEKHPELFRIHKSSDVYPFVRLRDLDITYAEYIAHQYLKLAETFDFDGLMLGDGLAGFRSFADPDLYRDKEETVPQWTELYATVAQAVHRNRGILMAYDCLGFSASEARRHGVDYQELSGAGLDVLIYQSYPQAWGEYWLSRFRRSFDLDANLINLKTVKKALEGTKTDVFYTLELGDSVEKWWGDPKKTMAQAAALDGLADGRFLVWGNELLAKLKHN